MAQKVIRDSSLLSAHVGISIFDPVSNKYLYNYQGDKYFIPASNTKIPTCYAAMKYLGDSLKGMYLLDKDTAFIIIPTGDPTLLHPDFSKNKIIDILKGLNKNIYISKGNWKAESWGSGWAWNDYNESYMVERSAMPIYGNVIRWIQEIENPNRPAVIYSIPEINWTVNFSTEPNPRIFSARRDLVTNTFTLTEGREKNREVVVPFVTNGVETTTNLLGDVLEKRIGITIGKDLPGNSNLTSIKSHPVDSVLKPMMHRSDNFFAEQMLLMVSNEKLGYMNDAKIIDTLLKTDLKDLPQRPRWVDGSGLSRYNLFSPQNFVSILNKMKNEFGMERIKVIFPTGNEGTLSNYYKADSTEIFAKTGTLSGVVAISGYIYTNKNRLLIFSVLVNNHQSSATAIRRSVEKFLQALRK